jgi:hypothetical protein
METLRVAAATGAVYTLTIRDADGNAVTTYAGTETLTAKLWAGDDITALATPTLAWANHDAGTVTLTLSAANTTQTPATYQIRCTVTDGGVAYEFYRAWLKIEASPGSATAPATYCGFDDMLELAGDLADALLESSDQAGFAEQRAKARRWTDRVVVARAKDVISTQAERHSPVVGSEAIDITTGVDDGPEWGPSIYPDTSIRDAVDVIRAALAADDLILDAEVVEANAAYALALVYGRQMGAAPNGANYQDLAGKWREYASRRMVAWTARFDTTASPDGVADLEIDA